MRSRNKHYIAGMAEIIRLATELKCPSFHLCSSKLRFLDGPHDFLRELKIMVHNTSRKFSISSLYVGGGEEEMSILRSLESLLNRNVQGTLIVDGNRQNRSTGANHQLELLSEKCSNFRLSKYVNKASRIFTNLSANCKIPEIFGVHHMKYYVFDDRILLTG